MVGHLGTPELAALALAGTLITGAFTLFNFLTYGTTAQVARLHGAAGAGAPGGSPRRRCGSRPAIGVAARPRCSSRSPSRSWHLLGGEGRTEELAVDLPAHRVARACRSR